MLALEGKQLGNYDVIRRIRVGGMGAVYEGRQRTAFGRRVAIKVILGNYASDREMRRRFSREARTIAQLQHPHILPLIEFGEEQGLLYLVMPFIDGGTLTNYLRRNLPDLNEVAAIYLQLLDAVEYAHEQGLIHRDIKSSNVLLELRRGTQPCVYLADFGLVRKTQSQTGEIEVAGTPIPLDQVPGTPHYMAPEQTRGIVTPRTDIYALGVLLYQMLTGELPYDDPDEIRVIQMHLSSPIPSPCDSDASIPPELDQVVGTAMAKRPEDRFASVAELREAFLEAMKGPVAPVPDEELVLEDEVVPPDRPISLPLTPQPPPVPGTVSRRVQHVVTPLSSLARDRQWISEPLPGRPDPKRVARNGRGRFGISVLAATLVPVTLLLLLLMPRLLGVSIFPAGFPVFGAAPVAVVSITVQNKILHDTYLLTASPKTDSSDLATRTIPSHFVHATPKPGSNVTQTTGVKSMSAVQASGTIQFSNSRIFPITVPAQVTFTTTTDVQVQTTQAVDVPARQGEQNGTASAPAVAVIAGVAGNIPAHSLVTTCCGGLFVSNQASFIGGVDARQVHVVAQADLDTVSANLSPGLEQQAYQQIQGKLNASEVMVDSPTYDIVVTSDKTVGSQAVSVQVQVTVTATAPVYNRDAASHLAAQLLNRKAVQTFGDNFQLQGPPAVDTPQVVPPVLKGVIYLSVSVHGLWIYQLSQQQMDQWRQFIKGATSALAMDYLKKQTGVVAVRIQLAFGADHLPSSVDQIKIVLVNHAP